MSIVGGSWCEIPVGRPFVVYATKKVNKYEYSFNSKQKCTLPLLGDTGTGGASICYLLLKSPSSISENMHLLLLLRRVYFLLLLLRPLLTYIAYR